MSIGSIGSTPAIYTPPLNPAKPATTTQLSQGSDPDHDGDVDGAGPDSDGKSGGMNILA